jgi:hypothetical protein
MNTYYVPMDNDIPHSETTRYEREIIIFLVEVFMFIKIVFRYA